MRSSRAVALSLSSTTSPAFSRVTMREVSSRTRLETLMDGGFADAEVAGRLGLRVAGVEEGAEVGVGDFGARHVGPFPEAKLTSDWRSEVKTEAVACSESMP